MATTIWRSFPVRDREVGTIYVKRGDTVEVSAPATDRIQLGGAFGLAGQANPDGVAPFSAAGAGFPAPALNRHSLIARIGVAGFVQAGSAPRAFTAPVDGLVRVHVNDDILGDNGGGWNVAVARTTSRRIDDLPQPSTNALCQGTRGNFHLVVTGNMGALATGGGEGDLLVWKRDNASGVWRFENFLGVFHNADGRLTAEEAAQYPSAFVGTEGLSWTFWVQGGQVWHWAQPSWDGGQLPPVVRRQAVPGASDCAGPFGIVQSRYGSRGNFELVYPATDGRMKMRFAPNDSRSVDPLRAPVTWDPRVPSFGEPGVRVEAVRLMHSSYGNLEVMAVERLASGSVRLRHWYRQDWFDATQSPSRQWEWRAAEVLPGSERIRPGCVPAFIQTSFPTGEVNGNFEVIAPAVNGGLLHWSWRHSTRWRVLPAINPGGPVVHAVHALQGGFGNPGNLEVVVEIGGAPSDLNPAGVGFGRLFFYSCDNTGTWDSGQGRWSGPIPVS
jgi:hypothetical protein